MKKCESCSNKSWVSYQFYPNGIVMVSTENSNNPYRLDSVWHPKLVAYYLVYCIVLVTAHHYLCLSSLAQLLQKIASFIDGLPQFEHEDSS